ncbi:unnamed protein product [Toxocara canis]|uniref:DHC_N1 domain-containing protein n=1 Tax=Toxocara canis TaxID=6265 RepID=A0A183VH23_TOXCA|nr:unnamed protein product [Toxocara canis]
MDAEPERFRRLRANCKVLHVGLLEAFKGTKFEVNCSEFSPIQHVYYRDDDREVMEKKLNELVDQVSEGLRIMDAEPERFRRLRANCKVLHVGLLEAFKGTKFEVNCSEFSPIQHVYYRDDDREVMEKKLNELVDQVSYF